MQNITMKVECLERQDAPFLQKERTNIHEQIFAKSDYIFIERYVEEQSPDLLCEYNCFSSFSNPPKYDDDYAPQIQTNLAEEFETILGNNKVQVQQPESSDQLVHFSYEEEEKNAENFEASEGTLPFCFESFQFIKENYHAIRNQVSMSFHTDHL